MELKAGYQQTDVGLIPRDWDVVSIGSLASFSSGESISVTSLRSRSAEFPVPVYGGNGIAGYTATSSVVGPTVIVGRVGQRCGEVHIAEGPAWITDNALYPTRILRPLDIHFFGLALRAAGLNDVKNRNDLPLVTQSILHAVRLAWPPDIAEQRAIAAVLGDVDALIGALDRLIAKKRDLKQAAMQQLFTGQTRLPGFSGKWETTRLGQMGMVYGGLTGKTKADFGTGSARYIPFMNIMSNVVVDPDWLEPVRVASSESQNRAKKGDLFFNGSSETPEELGMCSVLHADVHDVFLNSFCFGFRFADGVMADGAYFAYFFRSSEGRKLFCSLAQGATRYNLSKAALLKLAFQIPGHVEQAAIATVLADMDAELAALEQRRDKTHALKQGMMQELLTGRTRLV